jgi:hypothetical protein
MQPPDHSLPTALALKYDALVICVLLGAESSEKWIFGPALFHWMRKHNLQVKLPVPSGLE